ncbi:hypothetical protein J6590_065674, partial [Homalodisca vitripennis]
TCGDCRAPGGSARMGRAGVTIVNSIFHPPTTTTDTHLYERETFFQGRIIRQHVREDVICDQLLRQINV